MQRMSTTNSVKKILIADDEPDILEIIQYNLQHEGYEVATAKNGNEAIDKAKSFNPDLIILDIMMPGKNGIEVCNILRTQPAFNDTLIVFLTALSDEGTEVKGLETGADDFIILARKEFELLALLAGKPGKVFLRNEILNQVWGTEVIVGDRTIDVHIRKVRQKLGLDCITTVKGVGYKFDL